MPALVSYPVAKQLKLLQEIHKEDSSKPPGFTESPAKADIEKIFDKISKSSYFMTTIFETDKDPILKSAKGLCYKNRILTCNHFTVPYRKGEYEGGGRFPYKSKKTILYWHLPYKRIRGFVRTGYKIVRLELEVSDAASDVAIFEYPRFFSPFVRDPIKMNPCPYPLGDSDRLEEGDYVFTVVTQPPVYESEFADGKITRTSIFPELAEKFDLNKDDFFLHSIPVSRSDTGSPIVAFHGEPPKMQPEIVGFVRGKVFWSDSRGNEHSISQAVKSNAFRRRLDEY